MLCPHTPTKGLLALWNPNIMERESNMDKEEKLFSVQSRLNAQDYDDVFRVYLDEERGKEKRIAIILSSVIFVICIIMFFVNHYNIVFIFYGLGGLIVGGAYLLVPVNKKFIATNRLMFGLQRETGFYEHAITTMEIFEDEDSTAMTEEEIEEATTVFSTGSIAAYENARGFLFAEGKISNQFLYIPKRGLTEEQITQIREFAQERCSGGYRLLETKPMIAAAEDDEQTEAPAEENNDSLVDTVCDQFYGVGNLHLHGEDGRPIDFDEDADDTAESAEEEIVEAAEETAESVEENAEGIAEAATEEAAPQAEEKPADE